MTLAGAGRQTAVLLLDVLEVPGLRSLSHVVSPRPQAETVSIDGVPSDIVRPAGEGPFPAWIFVNGAHPERRREPIVQRMAQGLARAGFLVVVPDLPGLGEGEITRRTAEAAASVVRWVAQRRDVKGGKVALAGASTGAGIALLTAARADVGSRVSVVAAVVPFASLERMLCLATTGAYPDADGFQHYAVTELHRDIAARSLTAALGDAEGRDETALSALRNNDDPARFAELFEALPAEVVSVVRDLSPETWMSAVQAPVEILAPPHDPYFPLREARCLASGIARGRLTVTSMLDHTRPGLSGVRPADAGRFVGWVSRCLEASAA